MQAKVKFNLEQIYMFHVTSFAEKFNQ